jgi:RNA polymerase sigma-70 factor (ECF subfamily)
MIADAAEGKANAWNEFVRRYRPVVRAYLSARWKQQPLQAYVEDAVQEVFVECLRSGGPLHRADRSRASSFKAFLLGIVRNIARRIEEKSREWRQEDSADLRKVAANDTSLGLVFDRAWARVLLRQAAQLQTKQAISRGKAAERRVELLKLRLLENRPIREIADEWGISAEHLHRQYAVARKEFKSALRQVVAFHYPGAIGKLEQKCRELLEALKR